KRLGLGAVLGYLVAGVLIGPYALKLVGGIEDVAPFASFGVVILLFLIGLEVQPSVLWRLRTAIFGLGSVQVAATAAAFAVAALAAVAAVVVGGRYLTRPIFRSIARAGLRESFTASALLIVVGAAIAMQLVGLSAALGAFLAGVVLADSEFRREVETDIEPFRGLLLGLFFVTVGAGLNLP